MEFLEDVNSATSSNACYAISDAAVCKACIVAGGFTNVGLFRTKILCFENSNNLIQKNSREKWVFS